MLKKQARFCLAWVLFALADAVSELFVLDILALFFYPLYNFLMTKSADVQGDSEHGPWENVIEGEKEDDMK